MNDCFIHIHVFSFSNNLLMKYSVKPALVYRASAGLDQLDGSSAPNVLTVAMEVFLKRSP